MAEHVVLLHGLSRDPRIMQPLEAHLTQAGFLTFNIGYPSTTASVADLSAYILTKIEPLYALSTPLHFVGHSLGAILVRYILWKMPPKHVGRVVLLAPPNQGTPVVDFLKRFACFREQFGPSLSQIGKGSDSICRQLPEPTYDAGVIAGNRSIDWLLSWFLLRGPDDGKVAVADTMLAGMRDHRVLPVDHAGMPQDPDVMAQTLYFIRQGQFQSK